MQIMILLIGKEENILCFIIKAQWDWIMDVLKANIKKTTNTRPLLKTDEGQ